MPNIVPPNAQQPITETDDRAGIMQQVFRTWVNAITRLDPLIGTGSPEGVVEALQFRKYVDTTIPAVPGSIEYIKMQPDIAGDKTKGWSLL